MSKSFWFFHGGTITCILLAICLTRYTEQTRWQKGIESVREVGKKEEAKEQKIDMAILTLKEIGEEAKAKELEDRKQRREEKRKAAMSLLAADIEPEPSLWEYVPGWVAICSQERKTAIMGLTLLGLIICSGLFSLATVIKEEIRRLEGKVKTVATQAELNRELRTIKESRDQIEKEKEIWAKTIASLAQQQEALLKDRRNLEKEITVFKAEQLAAREEGDQVARDRAAAHLMLDKAIELQNGVKKEAEPTAEPSLIPTETNSWKFWVTFSSNDEGVELPSDREGFLTSLRSWLEGEAYHDLDPEIVWNKLNMVSRLTKQQRFELKEVSYADPVGWKIIRIGRKQRIFLWIEEEKKKIRFLPCPRDESYKD